MYFWSCETKIVLLIVLLLTLPVFVPQTKGGSYLNLIRMSKSYSTTRRGTTTLTAQHHKKRGTYPHCATLQERNLPSLCSTARRGTYRHCAAQQEKRNLPSLCSTSRRGTYPHCAAPQERNLPSLRSTARREEPTLTAQHRKKWGTYPHWAAPQERNLPSLCSTTRREDPILTMMIKFDLKFIFNKMLIILETLNILAANICRLTVPFFAARVREWSFASKYNVFFILQGVILLLFCTGHMVPSPTSPQLPLILFISSSLLPTLPSQLCV